MSAVDETGPLPAGWRRARVAEVAKSYHGGTPSKAEPAYWNGTIPWISPKDMRHSRLCSAEDNITQAGVVASATRIVNPGAILVVARSGILARHLPIAIADVALAFNQDIKALVPTSDIESRYLSYAIRHQEPFVLREGVKKGATVHSLKSSFLENLSIPLPPLPEQRRIADLLDGAMAQQARARAAIASQLVALESLAGAISAAAFRGDL